MNEHVALLHALFSHAEGIQEHALLFLIGYALVLEPRGWRIQHSGKGTASYSLRRDDAVDPQFHIRYGRKPWRLVIKDAWFDKDVTSREELILRSDINRFVDRVAALP